MPEMRAESPSSLTYVPDRAGGRIVHALSDGSCLTVDITPTMEALLAEQLVASIADRIRREKK